METMAIRLGNLRGTLAGKLLAAALAAILFSTNLFDRSVADADDLAPALAGDLDPTFGNGGKVTTDFFGGRDQAYTVAIQPDGKIIAAGSAFENGTGGAFGVARYNADGSLDSSFGNGGKVVTDGVFFTYALALQRDGKIIAAGGGSSFNAVRYQPDGSLDTSFGDRGKIITAFTDGAANANAIAIQEDGRIILAGAARAPGPNFAQDFALVRYNPDGRLDTSFGMGGSVITDFSGGHDEANGIVIQPDGGLVVAGLTNHGTGFSIPDFALARYRADGSLDTSFGAGGKVVTDFFGMADAAFGLAPQPDGRLIAAGLCVYPGVGNTFGLARYNADGSLDLGFGSGGKVSTFQRAEAHAVLLQPDGRIIAIGSGGVGSEPLDFFVARYNSNGTLDSGFGNGGVVKTDFSVGHDVAQAAVLQQDGQIVVAGYAYPGSGEIARSDFVLARFRKEDGPDFALSIAPASITVSRGAKRTVLVDIIRVGGFTGNVTITAPDTSALKVKINPSSKSTTETSLKFKFKIKSSAPLGNYRLDFTGSDDSGRTRTASISLVVQ